ncbi:TGF-beta receptor type-1-like isoform X2 [Sycon ciliatum]|uniref:TGF-beta receptor type-1-like isoform X2 n=1 Tax=Sycon ciliatum TaxID=27933 RepID=UPI0031F5FF14
MVQWDIDGELVFGCKTVLTFANGFVVGPATRPPSCDNEPDDPPVKKCCYENMCTENYTATPTTTATTAATTATTATTTATTALASTSSSITSTVSTSLAVTISMPLVAAFVLFSLAAFLVYKLYRRSGAVPPDDKLSRSSSMAGGDDEAGLSSGGALSSGRQGVGRLAARSLADAIDLDKTISLGCGAYGTVYKGVWRDRQVAVKLFTDERAFRWEHDILSVFNLSHRSIVEFFGADMVCGESSITQYWLITEYYQLGSLQRYLCEEAFSLVDTSKPCSAGRAPERATSVRHCTCDLGDHGNRECSRRCSSNTGQQPGSPSAVFPQHERELLSLVRTIVSGVDYLHTSVSRRMAVLGDVARTPHCKQGAPYSSGIPAADHPGFAKPIMAHRDLKSANVLVRSDRTCVLADFSLAAFLDPSSNRVQHPLHLAKQHGTNRYLPPEILSGTAGNDMKSMHQQDIYSMGLTLWEIVNCCPVKGRMNATYALPYGQELNKGNPSIDEVRQIVCDYALRPAMPNQWSQSQTLTKLQSILKSSWDADPQRRPTSTAVARQVEGLRSSLPDAAMPCHGMGSRSSASPRPPACAESFAALQGDVHGCPGKDPSTPAALPASMASVCWNADQSHSDGPSNDSSQTGANNSHASPPFMQVKPTFVSVEV